MKGGGGWLTPRHLGRHYWGYELKDGRLIEISTQIYEIMRDIAQKANNDPDFNITTINADEQVDRLYSQAQGIFAAQAQKKEDEDAMRDDEDDDDDEEDEDKEYDPLINLGQTEQYKTILKTLKTIPSKAEGAKRILEMAIGTVKINKVLDTVNNPTIQAKILVIICNNLVVAQALHTGVGRAYASIVMRHTYKKQTKKQQKYSIKKNSVMNCLLSM